jgi:hypothetical protein
MAKMTENIFKTLIIYVYIYINPSLGDPVLLLCYIDKNSI